MGSTYSTPLKTDLQSEYCRWWIEYLLPPSHSPKLDTFCLFHPSFHTAPYLNNGPHYLRPQALRFCCSNHRLDVELGRHSNIPRHNRLCHFCDKQVVGDEYHAFTCQYFLDLQIYCSISITTHPQFISQMQTFPTNVQRYITHLMARIRQR